MTRRLASGHVYRRWRAPLCGEDTGGGPYDQNLGARRSYGRARCSIIATEMAAIVRLQGQSERRGAQVGVDRDLALPDPDTGPLARAASYAYARSVGLHAFT